MTNNQSKKTITLLTSAALVTVLLSASVYAKKNHHAGDRVRGNSVEQRFTKLDSNADEQLSLDEISDHAVARAENKFTRKDANEDGFLSLEEATSNRRGEAPDHSDIAEEIVACVATLAEDDETILVPEASDFTSPQDRFNAADSSGDGLLSLVEVQDKAQSKATSVFAEMDSDNSGDVSLSEFEAHTEQRKATRRAIRNCISELENDAFV